MEKSEKWSSRLISDVWALDSTVKKLITLQEADKR